MHIVVLAYGPAPLTKRAVNRARKLAGTGHSVYAIAAAPPGREATDNLAGSKKTAGMGTTGLRQALSEIGDEPTLIIHDDVVLTMRGLVALERELAGGASFAIPYSNDPGMDHFVGSLPAGKDAERLLDQTPVPDVSKPAVQIRPACIAGDALALVELLSESLPDPYAFVNSTEHGFSVAAGALAAHETACLHRLSDPQESSAPLLVAALIVKDEQEMLPDCLASLQEICDRVEICDTGSTDDTVAIAKAAGANVGYTEWTNDFGAARNVALDQCRDARYLLVLDADERVVCEDPEQTRRYLATYFHEHPALKLEVANLESDGSELYRFITVRIFQAEGTEYRGALHEMVHLEGDPVPMDGHRFDQIRLDHHGYAGEVVGERDKTMRNLQIAEAQHETEGDARSAIHLARSLAFADESPERAIELLEASLGETRSNTAAAQVLAIMGERLVALSEYRRAFDTAVAALEHLPGDDTALGVLAASHSELVNHEEFLEVAEKQLGANSAKHVITIDHNRLVFHDQMVAAYAATGQTELAFETAIALLTEDRTALKSWPKLVDGLNAQYGVAAVDLLVPVALLDASGAFLPPIIKTYPSSTVAEFCATYLGRGGEIAETIRVGLMAAAMSNNDSAFAAITPAARRLDPDARSGLADRVADSGRPDLADKLRSALAVAGL